MKQVKDYMASYMYKWVSKSIYSTVCICLTVCYLLVPGWGHKIRPGPEPTWWSDTSLDDSEPNAITPDTRQKGRQGDRMRGYYNIWVKLLLMKNTLYLEKCNWIMASIHFTFLAAQCTAWQCNQMQSCNAICCLRLRKSDQRQVSR